jgi:hypothetical protein
MVSERDRVRRIWSYQVGGTTLYNVEQQRALLGSSAPPT